jgi:hypothetical protein
MKYVFYVKEVWVRTPRSLHTERLYTLAAPGPVRKASVMGPRRVVTRRPQTGRLHRKIVKAGPRWRPGPGVALTVGAAGSRAFGQTRVLGGRRVAGVVVSAACPQRVDGTVLWGLSVPRFTPVGAARRRPLEGGVAAMLHVHWLGGSTPG